MNGIMIREISATVSIYSIYISFLDSWSWEFLDDMAGEIPRIHSGCESLTCSMETEVYCGEGGL